MEGRMSRFVAWAASGGKSGNLVLLTRSASFAVVPSAAAFINEYPLRRAKVSAGYLDDVGSDRRANGCGGRRRCRQYSGQPDAGSIIEVDEDDGIRCFPQARNRRAVHDDEAVDPAGASDGFKGRRGAAPTAAFERWVHPSPALLAAADSQLASSGRGPEPVGVDIGKWLRRYLFARIRGGQHVHRGVAHPNSQRVEGTGSASGRGSVVGSVMAGPGCRCWRPRTGHRRRSRARVWPRRPGVRLRARAAAGRLRSGD
jgi:hypothetical protein